MIAVPELPWSRDTGDDSEMKRSVRNWPVIRLVDAADERGLIENRTFEDCIIRGPAMLLCFGSSETGTVMEEIEFAARSPEEIVYEKR
jgi:hypothetical protein